MTTQELLTADEAVELSGMESMLIMIDTDIRGQCELGKRVYFLELETIRPFALKNVEAAISKRGFKVERQVNPFAVKVSW